MLYYHYNTEIYVLHIEGGFFYLSYDGTSVTDANRKSFNTTLKMFENAYCP